MSSHVRALADPWGVLLAVCAVLVGVVIHLPAVAIVFVGLAVWVGRALVPWLTQRLSEQPAQPAPPDVEPGSPEAGWLDHAIDAEAEFDALVADGPLLDLRGTVDEAVTGLYAVAELVTAQRRAGRGTADDLAVLEWATLGLQDAVSHIAGLSTPEAPDQDDVAALAELLEEIRQAVAAPSQV
jgi:hypothetical protein